MDITSAAFIKGVIGTDSILDEPKLQVAFIGRSNVGKSSVINSLTKRKNLVKSSSSPGKTTEINFFLINDQYYFVDLPGYGYARRSDKEAEKIRKRILWYLFDVHPQSRKVVVIIDAAVGLTDFDFEMLNFLKKYRENVVVVANKVDKLNQGQAQKLQKELTSQLDNLPIISYSTKTDQGRLELLNTLLK